MSLLPLSVLKTSPMAPGINTKESMSRTSPRNCRHFSSNGSSSGFAYFPWDVTGTLRTSEFRSYVSLSSYAESPCILPEAQIFSQNSLCSWTKLQELWVGLMTGPVPPQRLSLWEVTASTRRDFHLGCTASYMESQSSHWMEDTSISYFLN